MVAGLPRRLLLIHLLSFAAVLEPAFVLVEDDGEDALDLHLELIGPLHRVMAGKGQAVAHAVVGALLGPGRGLMLLEFLFTADGLDRAVNDRAGILGVLRAGRARPNNGANHKQRCNCPAHDVTSGLRAISGPWLS